MNDQSTRARDPQADTSVAWTLGADDAGELALIAQQGPDALNTWWMNQGTLQGFLWNTVSDLDFQQEGEAITGATFSAWPDPAMFLVVADDPDAVAWLDQELEREGTHAAGEELSTWYRERLVRAFTAGRQHGFAMGSEAPSRDRVLGWDGMELLREAAELLRGYEAHHRTQADELEATERGYCVGGRQHATLDANVGARIEKAARNRVMAEKLEAFLADPYQARYVHDGLREAREDAALGVVVGWEAALIEVRNLVDSGRVVMCSAIPPLVLLDHLAKLEAPEDMDEMLGPWRGVSAAIARIAELRGTKPSWASVVQGGGWHPSDHLRWAGEAVTVWRRWMDSTTWVQEELHKGSDRIPDVILGRSLGLDRLTIVLAALDWWKSAALHMAKEALEHQGVGGKSTAQIMEENPELAGHLFGDAGPAATVRTIEAAADAGLIPGVASAEELRNRARDPGAAGAAMSIPGQPLPTSSRFPIMEGLDCEEPPKEGA